MEFKDGFEYYVFPIYIINLKCVFYVGLMVVTVCGFVDERNILKKRAASMFSVE